MKIQIKSVEDVKAILDAARNFRLANGRPFVTVSYAQSLDGSIATANRQQMQLSGDESMHLTHQLRAAHRAPDPSAAGGTPLHPGGNWNRAG
jgi:hypothetical protein